MLSWKVGTKANALYRDGSKLSQPLNTASDEDDGRDECWDRRSTAPVVSVQSPHRRWQMVEKAGGALSGQAAPAARTAAPATPRRPRSAARASSCAPASMTMARSARSSSTCTKRAPAFRSLMNCFAIAVSVGLQYGVPLEEFVDSFVFTKFEPTGMVQGNDHIKMASSHHRLHLPRAGDHVSGPHRPGARGLAGGDSRSRNTRAKS